MSGLLPRRAVLFGLAGGLLSGCVHSGPLASLALGGEGRRVEIQLAGSGLHAWVYPEQIFVRRAGHLVPYTALGRALRAGDQVVFVHRVVRDQSDAMKVMIVAYDVLAVAAVIVLAVVTFGSGVTIASFALVNPNKPAWVGQRSDPASVVGPTRPARIAGEGADVRFTGIEPGDCASFYRMEGDGPWIGPGTAIETWTLDLWGPTTQLAQLNRAVVAWLRQSTTAQLHTAIRGFLYTLERTPLARATWLISPVEIHLRSGRRSIEHGQHVRCRLVARNTYGPHLSELAIALRLAPGLRLLAHGGRRADARGTLDEGGVWWHLRDVAPRERFVLEVKAEMDIAAME